jgi:hypothetical protein
MIFLALPQQAHHKFALRPSSSWRFGDTKKVLQATISTSQGNPVIFFSFYILWLVKNFHPIKLTDFLDHIAASHMQAVRLIYVAQIRLAWELAKWTEGKGEPRLLSSLKKLS